MCCVAVNFVIWLQSSRTDLSKLSIEDSHLLPHTRDLGQLVYVRGGGAIRAIGGVLYVSTSQFSRCSAGPLDGDFDSCELSFIVSMGLCTDGLGGAISAERTEITGKAPGLGCTR